MKINVDRLAVLAGLPAQSSRSSLNESAMAQYEKHHDDHSDKMEEAEGMEEMFDGEAMEEMIEVDEVMLVQELRRAKRIMNESRKRQRKQNLQEAQLKKIIEEEVENIFGNMNLNADWLYGDKKPRRSRKGYTHQGAYLKGIGFE
jgi:hypothetical protein